MQPCSVTYGTNTTTSYTYDALDRITNVARGSQSVGYTYFPTGMRQTMTTPADTVNYTYNPDNQLLTVSDSGGSIIDNIVYDGFGLRQKVNLHNGVEVDYTFDDLNRLTDLVQQSIPQNPIGAYHYKLDANGNRMSVTEADGSVIQWSYDGLYRLTSETRCTLNCTPPQPPPSILVPNTAPTFVPGAAPTSQPPPTNGLMDLAPGKAQPAVYIAPQVQSAPTATPSGSSATIWNNSYTYDAVGNRLSMTANGQTTSYTYNTLDQLLMATSSAQTTQYSYDGRGNLTFSSVQPTGSGSVITTYAWDARDRLTGASLSSSQSASFAYDDGGRRIQQTAAGQVTNYLWDEQSSYGDVVLEADANWTAEQVNYALGDGELLTRQSGGATNYYLHDGQNSVRTLLDVNGNTQHTYSYDAYGNTVNQTGPATSNPYQYAGQQLDQIPGLSSLYNLRAREYNPTAGRFLSRDTSITNQTDTSQMDRYVYAAANPVNKTDPSGLTAGAIAAPGSSAGSDYLSILNALAGFLVRTGVIALASAAVACQTEMTDSILAAASHNGALLLDMEALQHSPSLCHIPVLPYDPALTESTRTIAYAQSFGLPMLLNYDSDDARATARGNFVCARIPGNPRPAGRQCDEYPFRSTTQGGIGAIARLIPGAENAAQGNLLRGFYFDNFQWSMGPAWAYYFGGSFAVVIP